MDQPRPEERERALRLFAASVAVLLLGFWLKVRCLSRPWGGGFEFSHGCYSDTYIHYTLYGFDRGVVPYVTHWNEYPVLTGTLSWIISLASNDVGDWWRLHAITLLAGGLVVTWVLYRMGHDWKTAAPWALSPVVVLSAFTNYDLWALALLALGLLMHQQGRPAWSGLFLGLGAAAKLFPGFMWPVLAVVLVNAARGQGHTLRDSATYQAAGRLTAGFLAGLLPLNLWYAWRNSDLWLQTWRFQSERGTTYETTYFLLDQRILQPAFGHAMTVGEMNTMAAAVFFLGSAAVLVMALRNRTTHAHALGLAVLCIYLLSTKVYSAQHSLWILPLLVLARTPAWAWIAYAAADMVAVHWIYEFFEGRDASFIPLIQFWVLARLVTIGLILVLALRAIRSPEPAASPAPSEPSDATLFEPSPKRV